ncbi:MAG: nitroreductase family protein [Rhodospirillaceae bacterium]|nr:nitroreductase family protein [Rhodospirillaceae bacterium]
MRVQAESFKASMIRRRSVRQYDSKPVDRAIIDACLQAAHSAPSGANMQPWHFVVVTDPAVKSEIRVHAEKEEREFYNGRAGQEWTKAVEPMGTGPSKPFLDSAPYLIVVFQKNYAVTSSHQRVNHYYVSESVGIAVGILVAGLQHAGVATLIHTPRPMGFLRKILKRPVNERACMIVMAGYPAANATVPVLKKKLFSQVVTYI